MATTIASPRRLRVAGFAVGAVAIAGAAVYVTAAAAGYNVGFSAPAPDSTRTAATIAPLKSGSASAICNDFIAHFSSDLGTTPGKVNSALQKAVGQTLADEVANGTLTQKQADAISKRLATNQPCTLPSGLGKPPSVTPNTAQYVQALMTAAASALGITPQQLTTDLAKRMTLSQIAAAQKPPVSEDQFRAKLIANLKPLLDQAVTGGKLTSAQEQAILKRLQTGPIPYWTAPLGKPAASTTTLS